jgi:hypothetical protein
MPTSLPTAPSYIPTSAPSQWNVVISPKPGANWKLGGSYIVKWDVGSLGERLNIKLYLHDEFLFYVNQKGPLATDQSSLEWDVPATLEVARQYYLRFEVYDNVEIFSDSEFFTIEDPDAFPTTAQHFNIGKIIVALVICIVVVSIFFVQHQRPAGLFKIWCICILLETAELIILLVAWSLMSPAQTECHNNMIGAISVQTLQLSMVYCLLYVQVESYLQVAHVACFLMDGIEGMLYGFASNICPGQHFTRDVAFTVASLSLCFIGEFFSISEMKEFALPNTACRPCKKMVKYAIPIPSSQSSL